MNKYLVISLICYALALFSCTRVQYVPVERVRTVTETLRDTVVSVRLEKETTTQTVPDTTSSIETRYARSTATWHGFSSTLEHEITTKEQPIEVQVKYIERLIIDSIPAPYPVYIDKPVDKPTRMPLRWWERIFFYMGLAAAVGGVFFGVKKLR